MGLFDFLRRKDEQGMPECGSREFQAAVEQSAIPDSQSVSMNESGWSKAHPTPDALEQLGIDATTVSAESTTSQTIDLRGSGGREQIVEVLRAHGIDPDKEGQTIDASSVTGLQEAIFSALGQAGVNIPEARGFGGTVGAPQADPLDQIEHLAKQRDAGQITQAEFEAQKKRLLDS
jgi:putative oligomerization/nucleic acid binding protein